MTSTIATSIDTPPTAVETAYSMAERTLAVVNALSDLGITPCSLRVEDHAEIGIHVSSWRRVTDAKADVDAIADRFNLGPDDGNVATNYDRSGDTIVHGVPMHLAAFTGRA